MKIVVHTNSECEDALNVCMGQLRKYFPDEKKYVCVDKQLPVLENDNKTLTLLYKPELSYTKRLQRMLEYLIDEENSGDEVVLYLHEDMLLYDSPDISEMVRVENIVRTDPNVDFIKLIAVNPLGTPVPEMKNIHTIKSDYYFSVQPALWKVKSFYKLLEGIDLNIWDLETNIQGKCRTTIKGFCYFTGEEKLRGMVHYDSKIFPYTATGIVKGKWNTAEYPWELMKLFKQYKLLPTNRERNGM